MKIVQKYGGSSLADEVCLRRVASRIAVNAKIHKVLVVVPAQGKTTDRLTTECSSLSDVFPSRESDALLSTGEQVSAALLALALRNIGIPAVSLNGAQVPVYAEGDSGDGRIRRIDTGRIRREWNRGNTVIVTGFQGVDRSGNILTLGRGGSDTSAVALAAALKADRCMIFTDVDGVYSADPRREPEAIRFSDLHESTMLNLALCGAKVLHPRAAALAIQYGVPLEVLTSFSGAPGTAVTSEASRHTGVTYSVFGETATVCVVFGAEPGGDILSKLVACCGRFGGRPTYGCRIFRAEMGKVFASDAVHCFHRTVYSVHG